ncbi:NUDIX domain-containing protein [Microbulbifer sp. MCCC 1A16149]|uniref:NUDIX domain-containing protein n=1 Tax=Microbulbifer sp. MCCC 1A16149 TaxID=3411322 RepID=UPI003D0D638E
MQEKVRNLKSELLCKSWSRFEKYTFEYLSGEGKWELQDREVYDRGDGAVILLFNREKQTVVLTSQFRLPTFLNGNRSGMMVEACAGAMEDQDPLECVIREAWEETGYKISAAEKVFELYMSPGSVTEKLHFYIAECSDAMRTGTGGGLDSEQEYIEVLELPLSRARDMLASGEIKDAKTVILIQHILLKEIW